MVDMSSRASIRARFAELGAKREEILAASGPIRAERDKLLQETEKAEEALNVKIREAEKGLYELDVERGMLARAIGGRTGE